MAEPEAPATRLLHQGEAVVLLGGRVVVALEGLSPDRRQALLRVRVVGGRQSKASLPAGSDLALELEGRPWRLLLKRIHANSVSFTLLPVNPN